MNNKYIWCDIICTNGDYIYEEGAVDRFENGDNEKYKFGIYNVEPFIRYVEDKYQITEDDFKLIVFDNYGDKRKTKYKDYVLGVYRKSGGIKSWVLMDSDLED